jgi:hypothetical protein
MNKTVANFIDPGRAGSFAYAVRQRRIEEFKRRFTSLADMRVLDLGGCADTWRIPGMRAHSVTLANTDNAAEHPDEPWMEMIHADACAGGFDKYDLVYSNSLMEHLGGHARRQQFVEVVQESAPSWWIQTPYRYFPIEPHWLFPGFQFLPFRARVMVCQHWGTLRTPAIKDAAEAAESVALVELASATEMRTYFPTSEIWFERFAGLPKSIVAIKTEA